ncbi:MAG: Lrp/AsnC family transcriptional regulator [Maricaulis sp.]|jgi:Lrp/AsnC family transcriptional regulator|uniref:Lrp/AsnC family transcriptional regulator n=1 Tax=Maricaulis sp. TaxID=1486257 RepID=UPI001B04B589|nr:Lrp/AsnC family transcriptional regulator [Maricaulis sp.]MBO6846965.1 Lrp/AsnC family transcriptional regulator [Maricaulis sp.]MBO6876324.1 Lrp/AsnC family transcriptional regulator [Maricaulis sp.]MDM7984560.1 Lrp/AsnC family transcriptional regulator [Maricaulis sp.]
MEFDHYDRGILELLQTDSDRTVQDIADAIGLSATPTTRRIKRLTEQGYIRKRVALLDPDKLGLNATLFISVRTSQHDAEWLRRFADGVARMPEVVEFYRMGGDIDYLLKIVVPDVKDYDEVYKRLISIAPLSDVSAAFAMEAIKNTTVLPVK